MMMPRTISVSIDVDISEFDDDDLLKELQERGIVAQEIADELTEMFYAFKLGKTDRAVEIAKEICCNHVGMIL